MVDKSMILIKFQEEKYVKDLLNGKIYINRLDYFTKKEEIDGDQVVGDLYENCMVSNAYETPSGTPCKLILKNNYTVSYAYCLYGEYLESNREIVFEQKDRLKTFGDTALCIYNIDEFLRRVEKAASKEKYELVTDWITYYDVEQPNTIEMMENEIAHNTKAFLKRNEYAYQKEFRIVINQSYDENGADHIELNIGSISDISEVIGTEDLLSGKIRLKRS